MSTGKDILFCLEYDEGYTATLATEENIHCPYSEGHALKKTKVKYSLDDIEQAVSLVEKELYPYTDLNGKSLSIDFEALVGLLERGVVLTVDVQGDGVFVKATYGRGAPITASYAYFTTKQGEVCVDQSYCEKITADISTCVRYV